MRWTLCFAMIALITQVGCGGEDDESEDLYNPIYHNQLFTGTLNIDAGWDGSSSQPGFSWMATGFSHVVCAVFRAPFDVKQNLIGNAEDLAWIWHSGMDTGREGNVRYPDGREHLSATRAPEPLAAGVYYWGVWALDDGGHVVASSIEYSLQVD